MRTENRRRETIEKLEKLRALIGCQGRHPVEVRPGIIYRDYGELCDAASLAEVCQENGAAEAMELIDSILKDMQREADTETRTVNGLEIMIKIIATIMLNHADDLTAAELQQLTRLRLSDPIQIEADINAQRFCDAS